MTIKRDIRPFARIFTFLLMMLAGVFLGDTAQSQQSFGKPGKAASLELTYNYIHTNGPPGGCGCINLNGGGIAYVQPLRRSNVSLLGSVVATHAGNIGVPGYGLTLVTYTAGARYTLPSRSARFQPYAELQVGGTHASGTLASAPSLAGNGIGSSFAATAGGGVNLFLHHGIGVKLIDAEYLTTNYANGSTDHQNDLRLSTGLVFYLGRGAQSTH